MSDEPINTGLTAWTSHYESVQNTTHVFLKGSENRHVLSRACACQPFEDKRLLEGPVVVHREKGVEMPLDWGTMSYAFLDGLKNLCSTLRNQ